MSAWQIFRWPLAIAVLTLTGLITGLVSNGWGDVLAAAGLFVPAALASWFAARRGVDRPKMIKSSNYRDGGRSGNA